MQRSTDVVIIGGGIIGCSIAYRLQTKGVRCIVLDKSEIGAQASSAAVGLLAPLRTYSKIDDPYTQLLFNSLEMFPALADEIKNVTGQDIEFENTGNIRIYDEEQSTLAPWIKTWTDTGFAATWLSHTEVQAMEPMLSPDAKTTLYVPGESQVNTKKYMAAMVAAARLARVDLLSQQEVVKVKSSHGRVEEVVTSQGDVIDCGHLIIAAGCWSDHIAHLLDMTLPVFPKKGQVISLQQPPVRLQHIVFGEDIYLAPKQDGTILVGATADDAGYDTHVTTDGLLWLLSRAIKVAPSLRGASVVNAWAGLRPKTLDSRPILGAVAQWENVVMATGHNGFGITLSAITAREITQLVLTGQSSQALQSFGLDRFPGGSVKNDVSLSRAS